MKRFRNLFSLFSNKNLHDADRLKIETLKMFCLAKFKRVFGLDNQTSEKYAIAKVKEWAMTGQLDHRLKQMWSERI